MIIAMKKMFQCLIGIIFFNFFFQFVKTIAQGMVSVINGRENVYVMLFGWKIS